MTWLSAMEWISDNRHWLLPVANVIALTALAAVGRDLFFPRTKNRRVGRGRS